MSGNFDQFSASDGRTLSPSASYLLRAGAVGAMVGGGWTAFSEYQRVRNKETTRDEAIRRTATNAAAGAGITALIGAASHLARFYPVLGVVGVLAAGAGALYLADKRKKEAVTEVKPTARRRTASRKTAAKS